MKDRFEGKIVIVTGRCVRNRRGDRAPLLG